MNKALGLREGAGRPPRTAGYRERRLACRKSAGRAASRSLFGLALAALLCACLLVPASAWAASAPAVTGVSPASGPMSGGTSVTISGTDLSGATVVTFGTQAAPSFTVNADGSITATAPQNVAALYSATANSGNGSLAATADVDITVTTPAGTSATSAADQFEYYWVLTVVNGSQRKVYSLADLEGMTVYDGYGGFLKGKAPYATAHYAGVSLLNLLADSGGFSSSSGNIIFGTADNYGMSPFTYADVSDPYDNLGGAFAPTTGNPLTSDPGLTVVVAYGTGTPTAALPDTLGPAEIALLTTSDVQVSMGYNWPHYLTSITLPSTAVPSVTGVSPSWSLLTGGTSVTISGTNLGSATAVKFGSVAASGFVVDSPAEITALAPAEAAGAVDLTVTTPTGTSAKRAVDRFTFTPGAPTVSAVSPTDGITLGGASVTITGSDFYGVSAVTFGTLAATSFTVDSPTKITAVTPAEAAGAVDVTVTGPSGTSATSTADQFSYALPDLSTATIAPIAARAYTGAAIKPALKVTCQGTTLTAGVDYTVAYTSNTNVGRASVTVTGIGACSGSAAASFLILPAKAVLLKVAAGSGRVTVSWRRNAGGVGGYQVVYRKKGSASFLSAGFTSGHSKLVSHLTHGKSYSFRVRAYKVIGGIKRYGAWSRTLSVLVK